MCAPSFSMFEIPIIKRKKRDSRKKHEIDHFIPNGRIGEPQPYFFSLSLK